jgi:hypothetical protein
MSVDPNEKLPNGEVIGLLASVIFIIFPPYILFREGPIFLFGNNPILFLYIYSAIGGAICGLTYGNKMKVLGLISGLTAAIGGTALFTYYAFSPPAKEIIHISELLFTIGIGSAPGVGLYFLVKKIISRRTITRAN